MGEGQSGLRGGGQPWSQGQALWWVPQLAQGLEAAVQSEAARLEDMEKWDTLNKEMNSVREFGSVQGKSLQLVDCCTSESWEKEESTPKPKPNRGTDCAKPICLLHSVLYW